MLKWRRRCETLHGARVTRPEGSGKPEAAVAVVAALETLVAVVAQARLPLPAGTTTESLMLKNMPLLLPFMNTS